MKHENVKIVDGVAVSYQVAKRMGLVEDKKAPRLTRRQRRARKRARREKRRELRAAKRGELN